VDFPTFGLPTIATILITYKLLQRYALEFEEKQENCIKINIIGCNRIVSIVDHYFANFY
jgi:hypothetical protein